MIPRTREELKKEAFRLFEDGRYQESLQSCSELPESEHDPAIQVLSATNLFYTGKLDDAEVSFKDLVQKMPESSYVHSYLAKVLERKGDDGAIAEFVLAIHLDPTNQEALRSYSAYLLSRQDCRGALPVLRRLVTLSKKESDARNLVRALIGIGNPEEAMAAHRTLIGEQEKSEEYIDALLLAKDYRSAAAVALEIYRKSGNKTHLQKYLAALARYDRHASLEAYEKHSELAADCGILADYAILLSACGEKEKALHICSRLLACSDAAVYRLLACDMTALHGTPGTALGLYEQLIADELKQKNDLDMLARIIGNYRRLLKKTLPADEALARFLSVVSNDVNIASLLETARFYEEEKNTAEARSWYYRAYRADFLTGGLEYARFLAQAADTRESEKVMLYILSNVKRSQDLHRVATVVVDRSSPLHHMKRLMDHLIRRLNERRMSLNTEGLEILAIAFLIAARNALLETDYASCKKLCLRGIDVLPIHTRAIRLEDFLSLISACKEHSIADRPVMDQPLLIRKEQRLPAIETIRNELDLDEQEQMIVEFLRSHKKATELELRKALSTRRVTGIVNRLIQKAAVKNLSVIVKRGVGEEGEVYEYGGN